MLDSTENPASELPPSQGTPVRDSSHTRIPVMAFVADDETEAALRGGLLSAVENVEIHRGTILHAIKHLAKVPSPRALIVDISRVANPLSEMDNLAAICTPDVIVLVLGEYNEVGLYRHLVRNMGVAEYLHKPVTRDRVARLFVPQITGAMPGSAAAHGGSLIAVCGARGGVGATTVAVNVALQLSESTRGHIALLDLHLRQGSAALMLGVKPVNGLRLALEQPDRADALFLDRVSVEINERLRLIAADEALDGMPAPTPQGMNGVLDLLRRRFNYIVTDMPTPASLAEMQALRATRQLLVVMTPDLASVRDADRLRQLGASAGAAHSTFVLNRLGMQGGLKLSLIEQGLGSRPPVLIPELGRELGRAANLGKPALSECAPFRKAIGLLAQEISGAPTSHASGRSLFSRMLGK